LDDEGFLLERGLWDRDVAQRLAAEQGLGPLSPTQWLIIDFVRDKYYRLGALPPMRNMCRKLGVDREAVKKSFGGCRQLWQIAGLPNPGSEMLGHMG
jgi:tRNA 2-thiouridine synthesizing protein E